MLVNLFLTKGSGTSTSQSEIQVRILLCIGSYKSSISNHHLSFEDVVSDHAKFSGAESPSTAKRMASNSDSWAVACRKRHLAKVPECQVQRS